MIECYIDDQLNIFKEGKRVEISQKKLCAIFAYFLVEKEVLRTDLAAMFFQGNKSTIRNAMYMINKLVGATVLINLDRNYIVLNPAEKIVVNINNQNEEVLKNINLKNDKFIEWKMRISKPNYYVHQDVLNKVVVNLKNKNKTNVLISGLPGSGKADFVNKILNAMGEVPKCNITCIREEQHFLLNTMYLIFDRLNHFSKTDIMRAFNDIVFHNEEAFNYDGDNMFANYISFDQLLIEIITTEFKKRSVVIIDDAQWIDKNSLNIIVEITSNEQCPIDFILIYNSSIETVLEDKLKHFKKFKLNDWNENSLKKYLELNYPELDQKATQIIEATNGNALGVEFAIKQLLKNEEIKSFDQIIVQGISNLSDRSLEVLNYISIFNFAPSIQFVFDEFADYKIEDIINELESNNFIFLRYIGDVCYLSISHGFLKNIIYDQIDEKTKKLYHEKIALMCEKTRTKGNIKQVYDIYSHLIRTDNVLKQAEYKIKMLSIVSSYTHSFFPVTNKFDFVTSDKFDEHNIYEQISEVQDFISQNEKVKSNDGIMIDFLLLKNRINVTTGIVNGVKESIRELIEWCKKNGDDEEKTKAYFLMIYHAMNIGDANLITVYLDKLKKLDNHKYAAIIKRYEGVMYLINQEYDKAIFALNDAVELSSKLSKELAEVNLVASYAYLGEAYICNREYKRAIKDLERGRKIVADSINYIRGSVLIYSYLATSYYFLDDLNQAKKYVDRAIMFFDQSMLCFKRARTYIFASWIYDSLGVDTTAFSEKIENCKIKYHTLLEKKMYQLYLQKLQQ